MSGAEKEDPKARAGHAGDDEPGTSLESMKRPPGVEKSVSTLRLADRAGSLMEL